MLRVPPVVVRAVELAEHPLRALGGQVGQPRQVRTGVGEVAALLGGPESVSTLTPGEPALLQCQVPDGTAGVTPAGQPFCLSRGRVGAVSPARVSMHGDEYPWFMGQGGDVRAGWHGDLALNARFVFGTMNGIRYCRLRR
jgi:hypothetical protein